MTTNGAKGSRGATRSELATALAKCRGAFVGIGLFSGTINVLMLTGSLFMLEVYDRVLPSRSVATLIGLSVLALLLFSFMGLIEIVRGRLLVRIGSSLDEALNERVYDTVVRLPLRAGDRADGMQPVRDLDTVRTFLSGLGPTALFDLPWMPLYLAICFAFHFWIGMTALIGTLVLVVVTLMTEVLTRNPTKKSTELASVRNRLAETSSRNAEVLIAMGMASRVRARWAAANQNHIESQRHLSDVVGGLGNLAKVLRMALQSAVLAVGAYLVIHQEATGGIIIAGSILAARALAPVDLAIANWRGFVAARQSWARLNSLLAAFPAKRPPMALPRPSNNLTVEDVSIAPPGTQKIVVQGVSFSLTKGSGLGIIGPSASGKSSLARVLVGVWQPVRGKLQFDGATLDQWSNDAIGRDIGYLPQNVELLAGTVAQNISRFDPDADPKAIIAAAQAAGVHDMIVQLGAGYETEIGEQGSALSSGQRQRIALARALYGDPFIVVLDEPNSNLDNEGEEALTKAMLSTRARGGIVVVVAHRPNALAGVDYLLVMHAGQMKAFGPKDEVLARAVRREATGISPLKAVP